MNISFNLPYFKTEQTKQQLLIALFLKRKFYPYIKRKFPQHYLVQSIPYKNLEYIHKFCQRYPYFLSLDIKLYYPSIDHSILLQRLKELKQITKRLTQIERSITKIAKKLRSPTKLASSGLFEVPCGCYDTKLNPSHYHNAFLYFPIPQENEQTLTSIKSTTSQFSQIAVLPDQLKA
ncbi:MAG: hypothetical protein Q8O30_10835 [Candidatus Omnitrophota bacterium]|nr:hypothetical protein [Candidatus Omnitrophota bacterium]